MLIYLFLPNISDHRPIEGFGVVLYPLSFDYLVLIARCRDSEVRNDLMS